MKKQKLCALLCAVFLMSCVHLDVWAESFNDEIAGIQYESIEELQSCIKTHSLMKSSHQSQSALLSSMSQLFLPEVLCDHLNEIEQIRHAALLHDVGLLMVPNALIQKSPYLNKQEMSKYKQHAASGANMIENYPCCQQILPYIRYHHEKWDGSGYPKHLRGANIPLGARIIAVADYYDTTVNPSTEFWAKTAKAKEELFSASGSLFDPDVVKAFIDVLG